jgi:hypothetical protein
LIVAPAISTFARNVPHTKTASLGARRAVTATPRIAISMSGANRNTLPRAPQRKSGSEEAYSPTEKPHPVVSWGNG